jgi:hypothetical protein
MTMKSWGIGVRAALLLTALALCREAAGMASPESRAGMAIWDTGRSSDHPLTPAALAERSGWTQLGSDRPTPSFQGDVVVSNGRMLAVFRKQSPGVEVHSGGDAAVLRFRSVLQGQEGNAARLARLAIVENGKGRACLEASYQTAKGTSLSAKFSLKKGDVALEAETGTGANSLRIESPARFVILPDFFADDIRIDAVKLAPPVVEVPSENFILHPADDGNAIVMAVFEDRNQDVRLTLSGEGPKRLITGSEIRFGKGRKIWVGLLETPQIWSVLPQVGNIMKPASIDWKLPYRAQWRADFASEDAVGSFTLLLQDGKSGDYIKPSFTGDVHSGGAPEKVGADRVQKGYFPTWSDRDGNVTVMPLSRTMQAPVTFYPLNRTADTPSDVFTVVDIARNCLGSGPCDYILDLEGHKDQYKGRATCGVRHILNDIYSKNQQKQRHDDVEKCLKDGLIFVTHIRSRVAEYLEFGRKLREYFVGQKKAHPELEAPLAELGKILDQMDRHQAERGPKIKTPDEVAAMNDEFRKNVLDREGAESVDACRKYTAALVEIGGNQDELVAECRGVVKALRQRAGLVLTMNPKMAEVAAEVRSRTQEVLRNPAWHEGAQK